MKSSFKITTCEVSDKDVWNDALKGVDVSVYFSWEYLSILQLNYPNAIHLLKIFNDNSGIITFYNKRTKDQKFFDIYSPYALDGIHIWGNTDEVITEFNNFMNKNNIVTYYLVSHPKYQKTKKNIFTAYRALYVLDLAFDTTMLWQNLDANHRYEINKFSKKDFQIVNDKSALKIPFLYLYHETFERVGANNSYNFSNDFLSALINSDITYALGAVINGNVECIVIFLVKDNWGEYYINASSMVGRNATRGLIWEAILQLKQIGVRYLNLGGGIIENDGLDQFKKKFGGEKASLNLFKGIVSPETFEKLCKECNTLTETTNYFPPYWANYR